MKWHVLHTRPRWEKKVHHALLEKGIESFCPLNKVHRRWSDRIKMIEEPLFKSHVFVKIGDDERTMVRMTPGVVNFVHSEGRLSIVREKEIQTLRKFVAIYSLLQVVKLESGLSKDLVIGSTGALPKSKILRLQLNSAEYVLFPYIDTNDLYQ